jgi:ABC-type lipoprotein export system ATPase subunit
VCIPSSPVFSWHGREGLQFTDEPTSALDEAMENKIIECLLKLKKEGKKIAVVTHSMDIAEQFDVIKKIDDGEFFKPNGILLQCISERRNRL